MNNYADRRGRVFAVLVGLLLQVLVLSCSEENEHSSPQPGAASKPVYAGTIVAVGDSLTAGLGVDEEFSYPARLKRKLKADGRVYEVVNAGVSGETTSGTLSRLDWIMTMEPDIVILEIGANDGLRGIDPKVPRQNIDAILSTLKKNGVVTVLAGIQMVWNLGPEYTTQFNAIYPELADRHGVVFMPFFLEDVATLRELNMEDGIHPNQEGYSVVVENIYPYVIEAIEEFERTTGAQ